MQQSLEKELSTIIGDKRATAPGNNEAEKVPAKKKPHSRLQKWLEKSASNILDADDAKYGNRRTTRNRNGDKSGKRQRSLESWTKGAEP